MQAYSNPKRETDPHALPDVEVFYEHGDNGAQETMAKGWYWWHCFPGCMPDSDPVGPFATEAEALANAREGMDDE